jgi:hypothetical protein
MLVEKYTLASNIRKEKLRLISGITALNLVQEGKFEEALGYRKPFVEYRNYSIDELIQNLSFGFLPGSISPNKLMDVASKLQDIANFLAGDFEHMQKSNNLGLYATELVGILNDLTPSSR